MIIYVQTDLFESPAQVLVNTVNVVGVMGKGIAKRFKDVYPSMYKEYQILCEKKLFDVGMLWLYKTPHKWILNFPTKKHWRSPSKLEYIESGLKKFAETYMERGITSISFPLLGCGNGGLDWESEVQPLMEKYLRPLPIDIFIHLNSNKTKEEHNNINETKDWLRANPSQLSQLELWDDICDIVNNNDNRVEIIDGDSPELHFITDHGDVIITQEQIFDLWRYLKNVGFTLRQGLPSGLFQHSTLIFNFLSKLPYIEPVSLSHRFINEEDLQSGIRLKPHISKQNSGTMEEVKYEELF